MQTAFIDALRGMIGPRIFADLRGSSRVFAERWLAIAARDRSADKRGVVLSGVRSWALVLAAAVGVSPLELRAAGPSTPTTTATAPPSTTPPSTAPPSTAPPPTAPAPFTALSGWYHAVWSDGAVLLVADHSGVTLHCRGGEATRSSTGIRGYKAVAGAGEGESFVGAGIGDGGGVAIFSEGHWRIVRAPTVDDDELIAVAVDDSGKVYAIGEERALYVADGDTWAVHRYPPALVALSAGKTAGKTQAKVAAAAWVGDGSLLLIGQRGLALRFADGVFERSPLLPNTVDVDLHGAWMSPGGDLWLISDRELLQRPLGEGEGELRRHESPIFGTLRALSGVHTDSGDVVAIAAQSELVLFDDARFDRVEGSYSFPEGIVLDSAGGLLYVAHRDGLRPLAIGHPKLAPQGLKTEATCPVPPQPGNAALMAEAASVDLVPPVERPALEEVKPNRQELRQSMPIARVALGVASGPVVPEDGGEARFGAAFALDVGLGATIGVRPKISLWPEVGYAYSRLPGGANHLFLAGVGPLVGSKLAAVGVLPRLALGGSETFFGLGLRTGLVGSFAYDMVSVEVAHQWLRSGGRDRHELRTMISVNAMVLLVALGILGLFSGGRGRGPRLFRRR